MKDPDLGELYEASLEFLVESEKAILVLDHATGEEFWIPLSQVHSIHGEKVRGNTVTVRMSAWIAKKKGLI